MRDEVMAAENGLKAERDRINGLVEQLKGFNPGTPEYKKLEAEVGNLKVQNADYSQIVEELSKKLENYEKSYGRVFQPAKNISDQK